MSGFTFLPITGLSPLHSLTRTVLHFEQLEKPLEKDDCIVIHGQQSYVVRVNPKTITVWRWVSGQKWEFKYPKEDFQRLLLEGEKVRELEAKQQ